MSVKATTTVSNSPLFTPAASWSLVSNGSLTGLAVAAASSGHESLEESSRPRQVGGQLLGVALHSNDKAVVGLDSLDCAVVASGCLQEAWCKGLHRLVMEAVHADPVLARGASKLRRRIDLDGVREVAAADRAGVVVIEMLHERAAQRDIDHLLTSADPEHRQLTLARLSEQRQLGLVELRIGLPDLLVRSLPVERRIDVPAAWQQQAVELRERLGPRDQVHRLGAGGLDRPAVGHVILHAPPRVDGDSDPRAHDRCRPPQARPRSSRAVPPTLALSAP